MQHVQHVGLLALGVAVAGCGLFIPRAYDSADAQRCVETALRRDPDAAALPGAYARFSRTCAEGDPAGCSSLGLMVELGLQTEADPARAARLYERACRAGNDGGCTNLGLAHVRGLGVRRDEAYAAELFRTACDDGNPVACTEYGAALARGAGVEQDLVAATERLGAACDGGHADACFRLGVMFEEGLVGPDPLRTITLYEKSCLGGLGAGCERLDGLHGRTLPYRTATERLAAKPEPAEVRVIAKDR